ncbi:unnamed protein product [Phaedon cochleariae]|uniref:Fanconi anemia group I protein n=1 Tax=Phaedon cochleariae TaxID=80249 RepID=A0A9N9SKP8_PHACE|nr:unnamed protein product [Phaedon cochleariae]
MSSVYEKFNEYGQKGDRSSLETLMESLDEEELINIVKDKINTANFTETWIYILGSFKDDAESHEKRLKLILNVLKEIEENDIPASRINTVVNRLNLELIKFKSQHLAKLCNFCLECIQSKRRCKMGWKDLLPELFNVLVEREAFTYENDLDYTGLEYKMEFISTLCMSTWSPNIVTPLASLFIDMPLNKEEHLKVVCKLGSYLEKLTPQEIPSFVYQMLKLCKSQNGKSLFLRLQNYFGIHVYNNSKIQDEDSDSMTVDLDAIESTSNLETIEAESTVLFHIHTAASLGYACIRDYLNSLKNMLRAPEFILHPFQLMMLFTISTITHYEETVFEIIRPCVVKTYNEEHKKIHSAWLREMVPTCLKPEDVFAQVIHYSVEERDLVLSALVSFAFTLLGVGSALGRDIIAEKQWNLGNLILLKVIKRKRQIALTIIQTLSNHIVTRQSVSQYIECLYIISKTLPLLMLENQSCIIELVDGLIQVPGPIANQLLEALMPLTKVSPTIRDHLIILLRKALYSRSIETRQMSVNGFLKLITHLKISNMAVLSQSSNSVGSFISGHSLFTQISMNKSTQGTSASRFSNEALCLEVLNILKRCFMQQVPVKTQLYEGLYDAVCSNPELGIPVLDMIWLHFSEYYVLDEDQLPPLKMDKIVTLKDAQSLLQEPLGKLIHAIGLIVTKVSEIEENKENSTVMKFSGILESICQRMPNCELVHFELDDGTDLLDVLPESQKKMLVLKETMCTYEALIGYKLCSWNQDSENHGNRINGLFQGYTRLLHFSKTLLKPKKADSKRKKLDNNKTTQPTQPTTSQKKESQKLAKNFKVHDTLLDLGTIRKTLSLLHMPTVSWTTVTEANVVKTKKDFHQHVMEATLHSVMAVKKRKDVDSNIKKVYFDHVTDIAVIIFDRIVKRLEDFVDFDSVTASLAMECFNVILNLVHTQYTSNLRSFLNKVVPDGNDGMISQLTILVEIYQKLFQTDDEDSEDPEIKKMSSTFINTLASLANWIPSGSNALSVQNKSFQMLDWLRNFAYNHTSTAKLSTPFINLYFETHSKYKISLTVFEDFSVCIGDVIGVLTQEEHTGEKVKIINEATVYNILTSLCGSIKSVLEDIESVIARLKSEYYVLTYNGVENVEKKMENLKTKERGVCCQLCFVVTILTNLCNLSIQPGNPAESIFKNVILLFGTLGALTRHFSMRSSKANLAFQGARFERLVKLSGKQLAPAIYQLILHMEESQKEEGQPSQEKKKVVDPSSLKTKVLRETRLIPKVVYEIEQFSKYVIQLSNKTKVDLAKYAGQGIVRDFRITGLKEALEQNGGVVEATQSTQADRTVNEEEESTADVSVERGEASQENDSPPPSKKSRI